ncbi:TOMM precursor leader peptide-binding protein [Paenibacillus thiaminolyticus]|uniref:TOMM precursor leader peptide-binding protein n=1 Tax=Paenibacillus thiaminolyticus TaxID=49283 RepID=UPI001165B05E|nr:TOMM precursor leader peptide-binding protein [Paenibacillus thiaminolyticus]
MSPLLLFPQSNPLSQMVSQLVKDTYEYEFDSKIPEGSGERLLVLYIQEGTDKNELLSWNEKALREKFVLFPIHIDYGECIIGPVVDSTPGPCLQCWQYRRDTSRSQVEDYLSLDKHSAEAQPRDLYLNPMNELAVAHMITDRLHNYIHDRERQAVVYHYDLKSFTGENHHLQRYPHCRACGTLPKDTGEKAIIHLSSRPKTNPNHYRIRDVLDMEKALYDKFVDPKVGIIQSVNHLLIYRYQIAAGATIQTPEHFVTEHGIGRSNSYRHSRVVSILEALERYAGYRARGKETVVAGSYRQLQDEALDPSTLGLHDERAYEDTGLIPYSSDLSMDWVWGYSLLKEKPVLVPEHIAYYFTHFWKRTNRSFYEISNGCALGGCPEEAIIHAILEVIERDAFLMTWLCQLPLTEIDLKTVQSETMILKLSRLKEAGYRIRAFDSTTEFQIPSVWMMAVNNENTTPKVLCSSAAHFTYEEAMESALGELSLSLNWRERTGSDELAKARMMLDDPYLVQNMHDHALVNMLPESMERFRFLLERNDERSVLQLHYAFPIVHHADLLDDLIMLLDRFRARNMDVIVVNQTTPELEEAGLYACKAIIPGMLPMTFGHHFRRIIGLDRLFRVPMELGYSRYPSTIEQLNPYPHPFP